MWLTKKILVPTDFGEPSRAAADAALELAQHLRVPLVLLHVYGTPGPVYEGMDPVVAENFVRALESTARLALNKEGARLQGTGVPISTVLDRGAPWEQIIEASKNLNAGLIVIGTHGRRGLPRAVLGSVAEKIVRVSSIPVLTVHERPTRDSDDSEK